MNTYKKVACPYCMAISQVPALETAFTCPHCRGASCIPASNQKAKPNVMCPNKNWTGPNGHARPCGTIMWYSPGQVFIRCPRCSTVMRTPQAATRQQPNRPVNNYNNYNNTVNNYNTTVPSSQAQSYKQQTMVSQNAAATLPGADHQQTAQEMKDLQEKVSALEAKNSELQAANAEQLQTNEEEDDGPNEEQLVLLGWSDDQVQKREQKVKDFFSTHNLEGYMHKHKDDMTTIDVRKLQTEFEKIDGDGNKKISMSQLLDHLMDQGLDAGVAKRHIQGYCKIAKIENMNQGLDELIDFDGFLEEFERMQNFVLMRSIQVSFREADVDNDGMLTKPEFKELLVKHFGSKDQAYRTVDQLFEEIDVNHDGQLSLSEIATWYFTKEVGVKAKQRAAQKKQEQMDEALNMQVQMNMQNAEKAAVANSAELQKENNERKKIYEQKRKERAARIAAKRTQAGTGGADLPIVDGE